MSCVLKARSYLIVGWWWWLFGGTVFTSSSVHRPFSLAVGVHKWLWLAVLVWRKANEASVCVCESIGPDKKKKKGWQWLDTQSINLFLYVQGHCVSFIKFCTIFLMRTHFILGAPCFHLCTHLFGSILYKWKIMGGGDLTLYFKTPN